MDQLDKDTIINVVYPEALPMAQRGQPDGIVFATARDAQPINGSTTIMDNPLDEVDPPREVLTNIYRDGVPLPANQELCVPWHGYLFEDHMEEVEQHNYFYNHYYGQKVAQMAHESEVDSAWVEDLLEELMNNPDCGLMDDVGV